MTFRVAPVVVAMLVFAAACSSGDSVGPSETPSAPATVAPEQTTQPAPTASSTMPSSGVTSPGVTPTTAAPTTAAPTTTEHTPTRMEVPSGAVPDGDVRTIVEVLSSDEMAGRDNGTPGSELARDYIVDQLDDFALPAYVWNGSYVQSFGSGSNIVAWLPGGELFDEIVMIGAHYDHVGSNCRNVRPTDDICNGAADNAAGTAAVIEVARRIAAAGLPPRRSVVIALWDAEEDGLVGSRHYVTDPVLPLDQVVAYVNLDIQGSNVVPSAANVTTLIGAETGGPHLIDAANAAAQASTLDTLMLSLIFGQGRSDHAPFVDAGVPAVFLSDGTNGCYHTVDDEVGRIDFDKLDQQLLSATALVGRLVNADDVPEFDPAPRTVTYDDAVEIERLVIAAEPDFALLGPGGRATAEQFLVDLGAVVDTGPDAFDGAATVVLLEGAGRFIEALAQAECETAAE